MRLGGYSHAWFRWHTNGTVEIVQNSKEPPKVLHVVYAGDPLRYEVNPEVMKIK